MVEEGFCIIFVVYQRGEVISFGSFQDSFFQIRIVCWKRELLSFRSYSRGNIFIFLTDNFEFRRRRSGKRSPFGGGCGWGTWRGVWRRRFFRRRLLWGNSFSIKLGIFSFLEKENFLSRFWDWIISTGDILGENFFFLRGGAWRGGWDNKVFPEASETDLNSNHRYNLGHR